MEGRRDPEGGGLDWDMLMASSASAQLGFPVKPVYPEIPASPLSDTDSAGESSDYTSDWGMSSIDKDWSDSDSTSNDSGMGSDEGEGPWMHMDSSYDDKLQLPLDFGNDVPDKAAAQETAKPQRPKQQRGQAVSRNAVQAVEAAPPQPKPLRMTVQVGHRVGDVCYARVPSTGQRVAGRVPPGLGVGDKFLVMYMPDPTGGARQSPTEVAMGKARDPSAVLQVEELLDLMHADTWTGDGQPPVRPLRLQEPFRDILFREPRKLKRRQKISVGTIDRWKNSGGKRAIVPMPIPAELRHSHSNVLVMRHGRVFRSDGTHVRYRQWTFGTHLTSGALDEPRDPEDTILYQIIPESNSQSGMMEEPLETERASSPAPDPEPSDWPAQTGVAELDFSLLGHSVTKRAFEQPLIEEAPHKKTRSSRVLPVLGTFAVAAILGVVASGLQPETSETYKPLPTDSSLTCSGTPEDLQHAARLSIHNCTQQIGKSECPLVCEPGYAPHGTLRCGSGISVADGGAACSKCASGQFSADGMECTPCTVCSDGMVATGCTATADTRCVVWQAISDSAPANHSQSWHLPQFASVWGDSSTTFVFGGKGPATPLSAQSPEEAAACPMATPTTSPLSSELWMRDSKQHWRLLGGSPARSSYGAVDTPVGSTGWPAARSSAASWTIPAEISTTNVLEPMAVLFSGEFPAPCSADRTKVGVEDLLSPSDLWVFSRPKGEWTMIGGEQSWAPAAGSIVNQLQLGYSTSPTVGSDLTQMSEAAAMWPLGRHDAQTWVLDGSLLLFSGALDMYVRVAGLQQMSKRGSLLNDYWRVRLGENSLTWENGGGLTMGTETEPRPRQPGPRVFGATWTSTNKTSGAETAWLFGGIGSSFSTGGASIGSAVAAHADRVDDLQSMCDLWTYSTPKSSNGKRDDGSPWKLIGACASDIPLLTAHLGELDMPFGMAADSPFSYRLSNMLLTEAALATTWVDSAQNLWLFGGAHCRELSGSCSSIVSATLNRNANPSNGRRQLQSFYTPKQAPPVVEVSPEVQSVTGPGQVVRGSDVIDTSFENGYDSRTGVDVGVPGWNEDMPNFAPSSPPVAPNFDPVDYGPATTPTVHAPPAVPTPNFAPPAVPTPNFAPPSPPAGNSDWMRAYTGGGGSSGYHPSDGVTPLMPPTQPGGGRGSGGGGGRLPHRIAVPCSNDLWMFDTTAMQWSEFTYAEHAHEVLAHLTPPDTGLDQQQDVQGSWPAGECGASMVQSTDRTQGAGAPGGGQPSAGSTLLGGWRFAAFAPCEAGSGVAGAREGADCSSDPWAFVPR